MEFIAEIIYKLATKTRPQQQTQLRAHTLTHIELLLTEKKIVDMDVIINSRNYYSSLKMSMVGI